MATRDNQTTINTLPEIKQELELWKEDHETWDDFFRKVLKVIEMDAESG